MPCFLLFSCFFLSLHVSLTRSLVPRGFSFVALLLHSSLPLAFTQPYLDFVIYIRVALFLLACARAPQVNLGSFCCVFCSFSLSDMGLHASVYASPTSTLLPSDTHSSNPADCTVNLLGCGCFLILKWSDECVLPTHAGSLRFTLSFTLPSDCAPLALGIETWDGKRPRLGSPLLYNRSFCPLILRPHLLRALLPLLPLCSLLETQRLSLPKPSKRVGIHTMCHVHH